MNKVCCTCHEPKPLTAFSRNSRRGLQGRCKACQAQYMVQYRRDNHDAIRETSRRFRKGEHGFKRYENSDRCKKASDYVAVMRPKSKRMIQVYDIFVEYRKLYGRYPSAAEVANMMGIKENLSRMYLGRLGYGGYLVKRDVYDRIKNHSEEVKK